MARARTTDVPQGDDAGKPVYAPELPAALEDEVASEIAIQSVLTELGEEQEEAKVLVYRASRQGRGGGNDVYLRQFTPMEFRTYGLEGLMREYGGGDYRIRVYDESGKLRTNRVVTLEEPKKPDIPLLPPVPQGQNTTEIASMFGTMLERVQQSMLTGFERIAQAMTQGQGNRKQFLEEMVLYKNIFAPAQQPTQQTDPMEQILKTAELLNTLRPPGADGDVGPWTAVAELAKSFGPALMRDRAAGAVQSGAPAGVPAGAPAGVPAALPARATGPAPERAINPGPELSEEDQMMASLLKAFVAKLHAAASQNADVAPYAEAVIDNAPPAWLDEFLNLSEDDGLKQLALLDPRVMERPEWFKQLRATIAQLLTEPDESATTGQLNPGDDSLGDDVS